MATAYFRERADARTNVGHVGALRTGKRAREVNMQTFHGSTGPHVLEFAVFGGRAPKILATRDACPTENVYIPFPTVPVTSALHLL